MCWQMQVAGVALAFAGGYTFVSAPLPGAALIIAGFALGFPTNGDSAH